jgi:GNAT superfamily N-acetyltransferase
MASPTLLGVVDDADALFARAVVLRTRTRSRHIAAASVRAWTRNCSLTSPSQASDYFAHASSRYLRTTRMSGKALLARPAKRPFLTKPMRLSLVALEDEGGWQEYERLRLPVEASFGLTPEQGRAAVRATRTRVERQGLRMWLALDVRQEAVGAIGAFTVTGHPHVARLQEVDVFPGHRGQALGDELLEALRLVLL